MTVKFELIKKCIDIRTHGSEIRHHNLLTHTFQWRCYYIGTVDAEKQKLCDVVRRSHRLCEVNNAYPLVNNLTPKLFGRLASNYRVNRGTVPSVIFRNVDVSLL